MIVCVTKIDMAKKTPEVYKAVKKDIKKKLKPCGLTMFFNPDIKKINNLAKKVIKKKSRSCPVFEISNVTREGIPDLLYFLSDLIIS